MISFYLAMLLAAPAMAQLAPAAPAGNVMRGKFVFLQCQSCHDVQGGGPALIGPLLAGVYGRKAGTMPGYDYSDALKNSAIVWNAKTLDFWLTDPDAMVPGTKMAFAGLSDPALRADVIAYMATLK